MDNEEEVKTVIKFDCKKLRQLLIPGANEDLDLSDVINAVTTVETQSEKADKHYFKVEMQGVNAFSDLLNLEVIKKYISQVALHLPIL